MDTDEEIFLCPECNKSLSETLVFSNERNIFIQVKCNCKYNKVFIWKLEYYLQELKDLNEELNTICYQFEHVHSVERNEICCSKCQLMEDWEYYIPRNFFQGILIAKELNLICTKHNREMINYCSACYEIICFECILDHLSHQTIRVYSQRIKSTSIRGMKDIENIYNSHQKFTKNPMDSRTFIINQLRELGCLIKQRKDIIRNHLKSRSIHSNYCLKMYNAGLLDPMKESCKCKEFYENHDTLGDLLAEDNKAKGRLNRIYKKNMKYFSKEKLKINTIVQLEDGRLVSGDKKNTIKIWSNQSIFQCVTSIHCAFIGKISFVQLFDGRLVSGDGYGVIKIWNIVTFKCIKSINPYIDSVILLTQLQDGRLISSFRRGRMMVFNTSEFNCEFEYKCKDDICVYDLFQLNDGRMVKITTEFLQLWDVSTFTCLKSIKQKGAFTGMAKVIQLQDGRMITNHFKRINAYDVNTFQSTTMKLHTNDIIAFIQLRNGKLVTSSMACNIKVWDILSYKCICVFEAKYSIFSILIELKNGELMGLSNYEKSNCIRKWDICNLYKKRN